MGFFSNLLTSREIHRLEEQIRETPLPRLYLRLSKLYAEIGEEPKARETLASGLKRFPEDEELRSAHQRYERAHLEAEKASLKSRLERFPSALLYTQLAEVCLKLQDFQEAKRLCTQAAKSHPDYSGLYVVLAKVALEQKDNATAISHLEKAASLDRYNYDALFTLAHVYHDVGNISAAIESLKKILVFSPEDERAKEMLALLSEKLPREASSAAPPPSPPPSPSSRSAEDHRKYESGIGTGLGAELSAIRRVPGVQGSLLIDPKGLVIASDITLSIEEELTAALLTEVVRTVTQVSPGLLLGEVYEGMIGAEKESIYFYRVEQMIMAVFASPETKAGLLQRAIHKFAESVFSKR